MKPIPTEHDEAIMLVDWLDYHHIPFTKVPNETFTKSWSVKRRNKEEGVRAGFPDYVILIPERCALFIELKRTKRSVTRQNQLDWQKTINTIPNCEAFVCKGAEEAIATIKQFLPVKSK
jgi:hypothetical protein